MTELYTPVKDTQIGNDDFVKAYVADPGEMEPWQAQLLAEYRDKEATEQFLASVKQN